MLNMNVNSPRVNQDKSNQVNPNFKGAYAKLADGWHDFASRGVKVTSKVVRDDYERNPLNRALEVNSRNVLTNFGVWVETRADRLKVVLTGREAEQFNRTPQTPKGQIGLFNKLFDGMYEFGDISVSTAENLDRHF